ncbi:MAG: 4-(cytidine 5'-diphospho)-2-C-methyl-D-erythritol kinase [Ruminococcaceae bacterium]|nr:4-(cytidine 5'-diphospho)-2-C-methyl-D-erythritol kinase [Oscillospiraceae bacterium]
MNSKVTVNSYAKINLMLDINYKRTDNYHDLFMIMQSVGVYDTVSVEKIKGRNIEITCNIDDIPLDEKNIAHKAATAFFKANRIRSRGIHIDIIKRIPHAAGLAGGSADGAAVLVALNKLYETGLTDDELCGIGVKIGADVPFCIKGGTLLAQGIGEVLSKVKPLRKCFIVLAKPDVSVNTGKAYSQFDEFGKTHTPNQLEMLKAIQSRDLNEICSRLENVFEQFIEVESRVQIKEIMRANGTLGACMSGSGPTVYGIFLDEASAENAAEELKAITNEVFVCKPINKGCKITHIIE